jgi:hypothetical protein
LKDSAARKRQIAGTFLDETLLESGAFLYSKAREALQAAKNEG